MTKKLKDILIRTGVVLLVIVTNITMKNLPVSKIEIEILYKGSDKLITENQVHALLIKKYGDFTKYKRKELQ